MLICRLAPMPLDPDEIRRIWETIAPWWDDQIGAAGNDFHNTLLVPANDRLLAPRPGQHVLDLACGNGQYARRLAARGCRVLAVDVSEAFLDRARKHPTTGDIEYQQLDCTREDDLLRLPHAAFDSAVCTMALMDMPTIAPLFRAARKLLKPGGPLVFSVAHPCFSTSRARMTAELVAEDDGTLRQVFGVRVTDYTTPRSYKSVGILNQPEPHWMFHRPIAALLGEAFAAGWVVDAIEEPAFPPGSPGKNAFGWAKRPGIPAAMVVRLR